MSERIDLSGVIFPIVNVDGVNYIGLPMDRIHTRQDEERALDFIAELKFRLGDGFYNSKGSELYTVNKRRHRKPY